MAHVELTEAGRAARNAYYREYRREKRERERERKIQYWNRVAERREKYGAKDA